MRRPVIPSSLAHILRRHGRAAPKARDPAIHDDAPSRNSEIYFLLSRLMDARVFARA
jgi:hypothetical protein